MLSAEALSGYRNVSLTRSPQLTGGNFSDWLLTNLFQISVVEKTVVLGNIDPDIISKYLAGEISRLARAARETCFVVKSENGMKIGAWCAIQLYYASFYYASVMLRICGTFPVYLKTSDLLETKKTFNQGSMTSPISLSTGQFRIEINSRLTQLSIGKPSSKDGVHEYVWYELIRLIQKARTGLPMSNLGQGEQIIADNELVIFEDCVGGIAGDKYLSSGRNDIQYRQKMNCWRPQSKVVMNFNYVHSDTLIWGNSDLAAIDVQSDDPFLKFVSRCLVICKICHSFLIICSKDQGSFLKSDYLKYHNTLMI